MGLQRTHALRFVPVAGPQAPTIEMFGHGPDDSAWANAEAQHVSGVVNWTDAIQTLTETIERY